jgi:ATP-dependent RNA helicase HelY
MVRWCKQIIDVLEQIARVAPDDSLRRRADAAVTAMRRGVVAY